MLFLGTENLSLTNNLFSKKKILHSDEELVSKYTETLKNEYIAELYSRYAALAYGTCMKYLKDPDMAKDAAMDVFEKIMKDLPKYTVANFKSWLYIVVKNHCLQLLKNQQNVVSLNGYSNVNGEDDVEIATNFTLDDINVTEDTLVALENAIEQLETSQKKCVQLFYIEKKSYNEIVDQTGYSFKEVKSHIQNGKRNLKIKLLKLMTSMIVAMILLYK